MTGERSRRGHVWVGANRLTPGLPPAGTPQPAETSLATGCGCHGWAPEFARDFCAGAPVTVFALGGEWNPTHSCPRQEVVVQYLSDHHRHAVRHLQVQGLGEHRVVRPPQGRHLVCQYRYGSIVSSSSVRDVWAGVVGGLLAHRRVECRSQWTK